MADANPGTISGAAPGGATQAGLALSRLGAPGPVINQDQTGSIEKKQQEG